MEIAVDIFCFSYGVFMGYIFYKVIVREFSNNKKL